VRGWFRLDSNDRVKKILIMSFNHLAVRGWFRLAQALIDAGYNVKSFNHLAVRGWFRLQTHEPAWLCGKLGFEF